MSSDSKKKIDRTRFDEMRHAMWQLLPFFYTKMTGKERRPSSHFCMGKREELAHRMAHFVKSCPIDFLFGIR